MNGINWSFSDPLFNHPILNVEDWLRIMRCPMATESKKTSYSADSAGLCLSYFAPTGLSRIPL
nr:hypothetical protein [Sphingobium sp. SJ10-10]